MSASEVIALRSLIAELEEKMRALQLRVNALEAASVNALAPAQIPQDAALNAAYSLAARRAEAEIKDMTSRRPRR